MKAFEAFARQWNLPPDDVVPVVDRFPFRLSEHFAGLIRCPGDAIWKQVVPDERELLDAGGWEDPLAEEGLSPVPNLVHRYPNRVLWLVSHECPVHCRFCTRKRRWSDPIPLTDELFQAGLQYIESRSHIKDVLLSGGDPLFLPLSRLDAILSALRAIPHVEIIRIGTRIPCTLPRLVTHRLAKTLARHHPLYVNVHFNHPRELTKEAREACWRLASAGIPLGSQTVLLRGVNDELETVKELLEGLLTLRVRPYYLMQMDLTKGTGHFRTPIATGLKLLAGLRNRISGLAIPHFVIDLPGGHGKVPLIPQQVEGIEGEQLILKSYRGQRVAYPLLEGESGELAGMLKAVQRPP